MCLFINRRRQIFILRALEEGLDVTFKNEERIHEFVIVGRKGVGFLRLFGRFVSMGVNKKSPTEVEDFLFGDLAGARTQDPHIKSVMLYLLSYQVNRFCGCKSTAFFVTESLFCSNFFLSPKCLCLVG